jgi:hypothetical protein
MHLQRINNNIESYDCLDEVTRLEKIAHELIDKISNEDILNQYYAMVKEEIPDIHWLISNLLDVAESTYYTLAEIKLKTDMRYQGISLFDIDYDGSIVDIADEIREEVEFYHIDIYEQAIDLLINEKLPFISTIDWTTLFNHEEYEECDGDEEIVFNDCQNMIIPEMKKEISITAKICEEALYQTCPYQNYKVVQDL